MYTDIKKVRALNGQEFIDNFKKLKDFDCAVSGYFVRASKASVWEAAKKVKLNYYLTDRMYKSRRTSMVIY